MKWKFTKEKREDPVIDWKPSENYEFLVLLGHGDESHPLATLSLYRTSSGHSLIFEERSASDSGRSITMEYPLNTLPLYASSVFSHYENFHRLRNICISCTEDSIQSAMKAAACNPSEASAEEIQVFKGDVSAYRQQHYWVCRLALIRHNGQWILSLEDVWATGRWTDDFDSCRLFLPKAFPYTMTAQELAAWVNKISPCGPRYPGVRCVTAEEVTPLLQAALDYSGN